jgi:hypothetical protein
MISKNSSQITLLSYFQRWWCLRLWTVVKRYDENGTRHLLESPNSFELVQLSVLPQFAQTPHFQAILPVWGRQLSWRFDLKAIQTPTSKWRCLGNSINMSQKLMPQIVGLTPSLRPRRSLLQTKVHANAEGTMAIPRDRFKGLISWGMAFPGLGGLICRATKDMNNVQSSRYPTQIESNWIIWYNLRYELLVALWSRCELRSILMWTCFEFGLFMMMAFVGVYKRNFDAI